jgi:hypothetical protein
VKISLAHIQYVATKIAVDLNKSDMVTMTRGLDQVVGASQIVLENDIKKDLALEAKVDELLDNNEEQIEFYLADERQLFWMMKKKLAPEFDVILSHEEHFSDVSHKILDELYEEDLINYDVSENMIKNIIYNSMEGFISSRSGIEDAVIEKMSHYKRTLIPGSDEYDIVFNRLFEEELIAKGMA